MGQYQIRKSRRPNLVGRQRGNITISDYRRGGATIFNIELI